MIDPDTGTLIRMLRSSRTQGDYIVSDSAYGLGQGALIRLDCETGRVLGVVDR